MGKLKSLNFWLCNKRRVRLRMYHLFRAFDVCCRQTMRRFIHFAPLKQRKQSSDIFVQLVLDFHGNLQKIQKKMIFLLTAIKYL